jgi:hypothetical protein
MNLPGLGCRSLRICTNIASGPGEVPGGSSTIARALYLSSGAILPGLLSRPTPTSPPNRGPSSAWAGTLSTLGAPKAGDLTLDAKTLSCGFHRGLDPNRMGVLTSFTRELVKSKGDGDAKGPRVSVPGPSLVLLDCGYRRPFPNLQHIPSTATQNTAVQVSTIADVVIILSGSATRPRSPPARRSLPP